MGMGVRRRAVFTFVDLPISLKALMCSHIPDIPGIASGLEFRFLTVRQVLERKQRVLHLDRWLSRPPFQLFVSVSRKQGLCRYAIPFRRNIRGDCIIIKSTPPNLWLFVINRRHAFERARSVAFRASFSSFRPSPAAARAQQGLIPLGP